MDAYVLVDALPGHVEAVLERLGRDPLVTERHHVHYGHFEILVKLTAPSHREVQAFVVNTRFARGVEMVREVAHEEVAAILASDEKPPA